MKISFICTSYNNSHFTVSAIASLLANAGHEIHCYIVDNNSCPEQVGILRALSEASPNVHLISSARNIGYFPGLNLGIEAAKLSALGPGWMIIGNNDLTFPSDFLDRLESHQHELELYSVISPDIVTDEGIHQNPHVAYPLSALRNLTYNLYYSTYFVALAMHSVNKKVRFLTRRSDVETWNFGGPIIQGHGSCYILTPKFFTHFSRLWDPVFMMHEEAFLSLQLSAISEFPYYSPALKLRHHCHGALAKVPGKKRWLMSREAHWELRKYVSSINITFHPVPTKSFFLEKSTAATGGRNVVCVRCVMDTTDSLIKFDSYGVCDHCRDFDENILPYWGWQNVDGGKTLNELVEKIIDSGRGKDFDCILGLSGGVDSAYLTVMAKNLGLRPLVFHVDGGWNSQEAVNNIENLVERLDLDLYTTVIDWREMSDLQLACFKSGVSHIDAPQDHAFFATMYQFAEKYNVKYILSGGNLSTECVRNPVEWMYYQSDSKQLKDIHRKFGTRELKTFPCISIFWYKIWLRYFRRIRIVRPLDMMRYNKSAALKTLTENFGFQTYPQKHFESRFTRFYEGFWLPKKFGFDTRKVQFSSLILTGQMTREEAIESLKRPALDEASVRQEFDYVAKKLGVTSEVLQSYMDAPNKSYRDYRNNGLLYSLGAAISKLLRLEIGGKR